MSLIPHPSIIMLRARINPHGILLCRAKMRMEAEVDSTWLRYFMEGGSSGKRWSERSRAGGIVPFRVPFSCILSHILGLQGRITVWFCMHFRTSCLSLPLIFGKTDRGLCQLFVLWHFINDCLWVVNNYIPGNSASLWSSFTVFVIIFFIHGTGNASRRKCVTSQNSM